MDKIKHFMRNEYLFSVISRVIVVMTGVLFMILFTRYMGPELVGENAIIMNYLGIISVMLGFGVDQSYSRFKKTMGDIKADFVSSISFLFLLYITIAILLVLIFPIDDKIKLVIVLFPVAMLIRQLNYLVMVEDPRRRNISSIMLGVSDIILVAVFMMFLTASYSLLVLFIIIKELIYLVVSILIAKVKLFEVKPSFGGLKKYISYGFVPMVTLLLMTINYRVDILMLEGYVTAASIGIYALAVSLAERVWIIPDALKDILVSKLSKGANEHEVAKVIRISFIIGILSLILVLVFGEIIIKLLFGSEFEKAFDITIIILFGVIGMIFYKMVHAYNVVFGQRLVNFLLLFFTACINIVVNFFLIPQYGVEGAAISSVISYLFCGFSFLMYFKKISGVKLNEMLILRLDDVYFLKSIFKKNKANQKTTFKK